MDCFFCWFSSSLFSAAVSSSLFSASGPSQFVPRLRPPVPHLPRPQLRLPHPQSPPSAPSVTPQSPSSPSAPSVTFHAFLFPQQSTTQHAFLAFLFPQMTTPSESVGMVGLDETQQSMQNNDQVMEDTEIKGSKSKGRSIIWDRYIEYKDPNDLKLLRYRCKYCTKNYSYNPKNGTTTMLNHYKSCMHNPEHKSPHVIENYCRASGSITGQDGGTQREMGQLIQFDQAVVREALIRMIIIDELPFKFVENVGFRMFMAIACPLFLIPSKTTVGRDCLAMYKLEREKLRSFFRLTKQRISITTDLWTSNQKLSYMVLIAHFVDDEWKLQKRILNFITCPKHKGEEVGLLIEECLNGWEIDNVFCIIVDNVSANDVTVNYLKRKFMSKGTAVVGGKHMHVRCTAHIINLIMQSGMKEYSESIDRVRHVVKYVRSSPARSFKFDEYVAKEKVETKKSLVLDVVTRWNSSYLMLERAFIF